MFVLLKPSLFFLQPNNPESESLLLVENSLKRGIFTWLYKDWTFKIISKRKCCSASRALQHFNCNCSLPLWWQWIQKWDTVDQEWSPYSHWPLTSRYVPLTAGCHAELANELMVFGSAPTLISSALPHRASPAPQPQVLWHDSRRTHTHTVTERVREFEWD